METPIVDKAILVGVGSPGGRDVEAALDELEALADTAGAEVVGRVAQSLARPSPSTYLGSGKAKEVAALAAATKATVVIVDGELTPGQQLRLEDVIPGPKVIDRTALILDVFAQHAQSREGKLQVELAQLEYTLPRLKGLGVVLSRLGAGIGTRGPGETQLEVDRRVIRRRIAQVRRDLAGVALDRETQRRRRVESGSFRVSLVGYTNAGKSTLLNALTQADAYVADQLFATLDSTTRQVDLGQGIGAVISDTVGFVDKLPHELVAAFRSTLDEVRDADLLLHVIDGSHEEWALQREAVERVLGDIDAATVERLEVVNKMDLLGLAARERLALRVPGAVLISAKTLEGMGDLVGAMASAARRRRVRLTLLIPYAHARVVSEIHAQGHVVSETHGGEGVRLEVEVDAGDAARYREWIAEDRGPVTL